MKKCSYCGKEFPDDTTNCPIDQSPLVEAPQIPPGSAKPKDGCPGCGQRNNYAPTVELRKKFNLLPFLFGGVIGLMFRNAGRSRKVLCNGCGTIFFIHTPMGRIYRIIFWLIVSLSILVLIIQLIASAHG